MPRKRVPLSRGGYMDVSVSDKASPETLAALSRIGEAALDMMDDEAEAAEHLVEEVQERRLGFEP